MGPVVLYDKVPLDQLLVPLKITRYFSPKMPKYDVFMRDKTFRPKCDVFISDTTFDQFICHSFTSLRELMYLKGGTYEILEALLSKSHM